MALGRYTRIDSKRQSSNYWSTVMVVTFVALCLVGVWMMTSSSESPEQNVDVPVDENKNEMKEPQVTQSNEAGGTKQFEDSQGDLPDDATKGDNNANVEENQETKPEVKAEERTEQKVEEKLEEKADEEIKSDGGSNAENQRDNDGGGDSKKPEEKIVEETASDDGMSSETQSGTDGGDSKVEDEKTNSTDGGSKSEDGQGDPGENTMGNNSDSVENEKTPISDETDKRANTDGTDAKLENSGETKDGDTGNGSDSVENEKAPGSQEAEKKADTDAKPDENSDEAKEGDTGSGQLEEKVDQSGNKGSEKSSNYRDQTNSNNSSSEEFPSGAQAELLNETNTQSGSWKTQAAESKKEEESQQSSNQGYNWKLCNVTAGPDYIPCLDNWKAIKSLRTTKHYEHRERHCPEEPPTCLVPLPEGYKRSIEWPKSREKVCCSQLAIK